MVHEMNHSPLTRYNELLVLTDTLAVNTISSGGVKENVMLCKGGIHNGELL